MTAAPANAAVRPRIARREASTTPASANAAVRPRTALVAVATALCAVISCWIGAPAGVAVAAPHHDRGPTAAPASAPATRYSGQVTTATATTTTETTTTTVTQSPSTTTV